MSTREPRGDWYRTKSDVKGFLLDITGVLIESDDDGVHAIPGSVNAVQRLRDAGIKVRFCTNETQCTKQAITQKLISAGFSAQDEEIFAPAPAVRQILVKRGLRPHLLVHEDVLPEFDGIDKTNPNCVVVGDAADQFSYNNMNKAFQALINMDNPVLIALGKGSGQYCKVSNSVGMFSKFYKSHGTLMLDVGAYAKALEYASGVESEVVGKPSKSFFAAALQDMDLTSDQAVMVGDDIIGDVGGAQDSGITGVLVRTGKYRPCDEDHPTVKPDGSVENLAQAVELFISSQ